MKKVFKTLSVICCLLFCLPILNACQKEKPQFRVLAYIVGRNAVSKHFDKTHFDQITDIILFDTVTFDENGEIVLDKNFAPALENIRASMKKDGSQNLYINILGPESDNEDWDLEMEEQAALHNKAFASGKLENNIKNFLKEYKFDGVYFDYEFPIGEENWEKYSNFIVSLDSVLGKKYELGVALSVWDSYFSDEAKDAIDTFALMSYDNYDDNGYHSTYAHAVKDVNRVVAKGFEKSKLLLGVPFYARPTNDAHYWYEYSLYYDKLDENGLYYDEETGLTFSFNTYDVIYQKTKYAIEEGLAGMMVWHYACDLPATNEKSLFNAIEKGIKDKLI